MAGAFLEFQIPGYSTLWTEDLAYTPGTGEAADLNPFDPSSDRPLIEGEWLERSSDGKKWKRGGNNDEAEVSEGTLPAFPYFMEKGRYDAQVSKLGHCVIGPAGYIFRTKLCLSAGLAVGDKVSVQDILVAGVVRRGLIKLVSGYCIGRVARIIGTNDIVVQYLPGSA